MAICSKCGSTFDKGVSTIYGIVRVDHEDNRINPEDKDTGLTEYKPVGLAKAEYCNNCLKKQRNSTLKQGFGQLGASIVMMVIAGFLSENTNFIFYGLAISGFGSFLGAMAVIVSAFINSTLVEGLKPRSFKKDEILYPLIDEDIDLSGKIDGNHTTRYELIPENQLKKKPKNIADANSLLGVKEELKRMYKEYKSGNVNETEHVDLKVNEKVAVKKVENHEDLQTKAAGLIGGIKGKFINKDKKETKAEENDSLSENEKLLADFKEKLADFEEKAKNAENPAVKSTYEDLVAVTKKAIGELEPKVAKEIKDRKKKEAVEIKEEKVETAPIEEIKVEEPKPEDPNKKDKKSLIDKIKGLSTAVKVAIGAGIAALIIICVVVATKKPEINLNDYLVFETSGYNGTAAVEIEIDFDRLFEEHGDDLQFTENYLDTIYADEELNYIYEDLAYYYEVEPSSQDMLSACVCPYFKDDDNLYVMKFDISNGDEYGFTFDTRSLNVLDLFKCKIKYEDDVYKVSGLEESITIDLFSFIDKSIVNITGNNGYGTAKFNNTNIKNENNLIFDDGTYRLEFHSNNSDYDQYYINAYKNGDMYDTYILRIEEYCESGLYNGDTVDLYYDGINELKELGLLFKEDFLYIDVYTLYQGDFNYSQVEEYLQNYIKGKDSNAEDLYIQQIMYFKCPSSIGAFNDVISVDYYYSTGEDEFADVQTMLYDPSLDGDGKLHVSEAITNNKVDMYEQLELEYQQVGYYGNIETYKDLLDTLDMDVIEDCIDAGYESRDYINLFKQMYLNENTYVIYDEYHTALDN